MRQVPTEANLPEVMGLVDSTREQLGPDSAPTLLTYKQVAKLLRLSERTVSTLVKKGELTAARIRHSVRFDMRDVQEFIDRAKNPSQQQRTD